MSATRTICLYLSPFLGSKNQAITGFSRYSRNAIQVKTISYRSAGSILIHGGAGMLGSFLAISVFLTALWAEGLVFDAGSVVVHVLLLMAVFFFVGHLVRNTSLT